MSDKEKDTNTRILELATINQVASILREGKSSNEVFKKLVQIIPQVWKSRNNCSVRIDYDNEVYKSPDFVKSPWSQNYSFYTIDNKQGHVDLFFSARNDENDSYIGQEFMLNISGMIAAYLNSQFGKAIINKNRISKSEPTPIDEDKIKIDSRQLLHKFLNKNNYDRDILHDLMPFKVREILLIANLYDAYSIEKEGRFSEHVLGEYQQLSLSSMPRITGVTTTNEALEMLYSRHFDLILFIVGVDKESPVILSNTIKKEFPYIPIYLLLNNNRDVPYYDRSLSSLKAIDKIFVWNGESKVFFSIIKHLEDSINVSNDTNIAHIRILLIVEDSPMYYSRYLPMLYHIVMQQTKRIIDDVSTDDLYKVLRMRTRPKILMASNFEDAIEIIRKYKDNILALISDVKFDHNKEKDSEAGIKLVRFTRNLLPDLPVIIQSSNEENREQALELKTAFINKNSDTLQQEIRTFITQYLGFGDFTFRNSNGIQIAVAHNLHEFEQLLKTIPNKSLLYHAQKNHFSLWLMARGEIRVAKIINPQKVSDFQDAEELRLYLVEVIQNFRNEKKKGEIIPFDEAVLDDESNIVSLSGGNLGGKGRGLAFVNTLINHFNFESYLPGINIRSPKTCIIGTDEFEYFLERNVFNEEVLQEPDSMKTKQWFLHGKLSEGLVRKLWKLLEYYEHPIAIRSSGLFEDSLLQPFAGVFETYILPNNNPDPEIRLKQIMDAIKLVYASVFSPTSKAYFRAINYKPEDEKMAIIIQEVVGNQFRNYYYPHLSGVAQSLNYYPFGRLKPEDGFANIALGLGKYVVEGEKTHRFSPKHPTLDITSPKDQFLNSQVEFYAVNLKDYELDLMKGEEAGLIRLNIEDAEIHGSLKHCASVYDQNNDTFKPGIDHPGPRVVNFANILKYKYIPLAKSIEIVLDIVKEAFGSPVEIEFAVDLEKDENYKASFFLLQVKPLIGMQQDYEISDQEIKSDRLILMSKKGLGNGLISNVQDILFVDEKDFDKTKTKEMAEEISELNEILIQQNKNYVLIGPGRWGTRDPWIGIPVTWPQISNAKLIVETSLKNFPLDASSGSHFFHNVTSMNVGYCSIQEHKQDNFINYTLLKSKKVVKKGRYFTWVKFNSDLLIKMDGKKGLILISEKERS